MYKIKLESHGFNCLSINASDKQKLLATLSNILSMDIDNFKNIIIQQKGE